MKIEKLSYSRKFNLGSYESEEFSIEMFLEEGESFKEAHVALQTAKKLILANASNEKKSAKEGK